MHVAVTQAALRMRAWKTQFQDIQRRHLKTFKMRGVKLQMIRHPFHRQCCRHPRKHVRIVTEDINGNPERACILGPNAAG